MAPCIPWKKRQSNENEVQDNNNKTIKMGRSITLVLFHEPLQKELQWWDENRMSEMTFDVWKPQRPQVQNKEDVEEDVWCSWKRKEDEVNMNEMCHLEQEDDKKMQR